MVAGRNDCCTIVGLKTGETGLFDGGVENDDDDDDDLVREGMGVG